jgi:plasmid stabilization system protein ParE
MTLPVIFSPEARAEFDEATDWYGQRRAGLGDAFVDAVQDVLKRIGTAPRIHAVVWKDVRCALVRRFPYAVYYRVEPERVVVIAVFHTKRDPGAWQSRA